MSLQEVVNRVRFGTVQRQQTLEIAEPARPEFLISARDVTRILKGRRLPKTRRAFRGFSSPPGRF